MKRLLCLTSVLMALFLNAAASPTPAKAATAAATPASAFSDVMDAAARGQLEAVKAYQTKKGNLNAQDSQGLTLLMEAVANGQKKIVQYLLQQNVNLELKNEVGDDALAMALGNDHDDIAVQLINAGAPLDSTTGDDRNTMVFIAASVNAQKSLALMLKKAPALVNVKNKKGNTPLHEAVRYGNDKTLRTLLHAGASKEMSNNEGKTPVDLAKSLKNEKALQLFAN